jgi:hypothetical protein
LSEFIVATVIITAAIIAAAIAFVMAMVVHRMVNAINDMAERHTNAMSALTNMFAESSLAISDTNRELIHRKYDIQQQVPLAKYTPPPPPTDNFDINAIIEAGPPHGGDPSK